MTGGFTGKGERAREEAAWLISWGACDPWGLVERIIPARPDQVYRAWLEPDLIGRWMSPGSMELSRAEVDERVGGHYRWWGRRNVSGPWRRRRLC